MSIAYVGTGFGITANNSNNTQVTINLGSTTAGHINVIILAVQCTTVNPDVTTPTGWTKVGEVFDGTTPGVLSAVYWRVFQNGDASSVTFNWTNAGQATGRALAYSGVHATTPIPADNYAIVEKSLSATSYSTGNVTTTVTGWIVSAFICRSGGTWSATTDTKRGSDSETLNSSAVSMTCQDSNGDVAAGTYSKTATGPSTTVGGQVFLLLQPASGVAAGTTVAPTSLESNVGSWTNVGGASDFVTALTDANANTYVQSNTGAANPSKIRYKLLPLVTPSSFTLQPTLYQSVAGTGTCYVRLFEGTTQRKQWTVSVTTTPSTPSLTLTGGEIATVTDWTNVYVEIEWGV